MTAYGWFLSITLIGPVAAAIVPAWRRYLPRARGVAFVWLFVSTPWLLLDSWQHTVGFWHYDSRYVSGLMILNLPLDEALFFYAVPLACLLLWHIVRPIKILTQLGWATILGQVVLALAMVAWAWPLPIRSGIDLLLFMTTLIFVLLSRQVTTHFLSWTVVVMGCFLLTNTYLTALPIVIYNDSLMVPWRLGTIPVSDIHYNFAFLWSALIVYLSSTRIPQDQLW